MKQFKLTKDMGIHGLESGTIINVVDEDDLLDELGYVFAECPDGVPTLLFYNEVERKF